VANNVILDDGHQGQQVIAVLPQLVDEICLLRLTESLFVQVTYWFDVLGLFFSNHNHLNAPKGRAHQQRSAKL
jgi:hypothetical protein